MNEPIDQAERDRFINELDRNFSVVASAGSGKTRAITDRIVAIARSRRACELLPTLVVVTFTNRAADEMQQRARQCILEAGIPLEVLTAFSRAFFGTIHSFCLRLLHQHGHHLGLTGELTLVTEDDALWQEFVQQSGAIADGLTPTQRTCLLRLVPVRKLMELGRHASVVDTILSDAGEFPAFDFAEVLGFVGDNRTRTNVEAAQKALREWQRRWEQGDGFAELPHATAGGAKFLELHRAALAPVREWLRRCSLRVARDVATAWCDFRLARGAMTYDDQIRLAHALLQQPEAARRIREKNHRVILDEAQDTDPEQFATLLEITRPSSATGSWIEGAKGPPRPGHFCMVGDFQQSIFGDRADLAFYRCVHDALLRDGAGEELKFSVTFRLDDAQIGFVNDAFAGVLNNTGGQVGFVHLNARPQSLPGQVVRLDPGAPPEDDAQTEWQRAQFEAEKVAGWLREQGLERLRAQTWRDVAILCPRKGWFAPLKEALRGHGFNVQLQSESDIKGDSPACAWLTALVTIMAEPAHGYEIVGVLREVFGLSDHDLAEFASKMWDSCRQGEGGGLQPADVPTGCKPVALSRGERWQISRPVSGSGPVADTLNLLVEARARIIALPLLSAIEELVRATQLRERLLVLPPEDFEDLGTELDDLLTLAAAAEAQAGTLPEFAAELRTRFATTREVRPGAPDAIQLITCHKAKGSEWQAVVVPFFGRGILQRNRVYPRLLRDPATSEVVAVLDRAHLNETMKEAVETQQRQELERLLYVTLSRAKHTLVIVDDRALFHQRNGLPKNAAARLLGCAEATHLCTRFETLPTFAGPCSRTITEQRTLTTRRAPGQSVVALTPLTHDTLADARVRAAHFRKRNPSALAELALIEAEEAASGKLVRRTVAGPTAGTRFGIWWHDFVERLDWQAGIAQWDTRFTDALADSPDPDLSHREWALLRTQLSARSDLAARLVAPGTIAHAEMPFLWAMNDRDVIEGIIDLAIFDPARGHWLIVDWKTNRTTRKTLPDLRSHYLPQISAYWKAVTSMLNAPVTASLYSTATGAWLQCEAPELSAAWDALEGSSAALAMALSEP